MRRCRTGAVLLLAACLLSSIGSGAVLTQRAFGDETGSSPPSAAALQAEADGSDGASMPAGSSACPSDGSAGAAGASERGDPDEGGVAAEEVGDEAAEEADRTADGNSAETACDQGLAFGDAGETAGGSDEDGASGDEAASADVRSAAADDATADAGTAADGDENDALASSSGPSVTVLDPSEVEGSLPAQYFSRIGDAGDVTVSISDNGALHYRLVSGAIASGQQYTYNVDLDYLGKLSGDAGFTLTLRNAAEDIYGNLFDIVAKFFDITSSRALSSSEKGYVLARVLGQGGDTNGALLSPNAYTKAEMYDGNYSETGPGISMAIEVSFQRNGAAWDLPQGASYNLEFYDIDIPQHTDGWNLSRDAKYSEQVTVRSGMETAYIPCEYNENGSDYTCWIVRNGSEITFKAGNEEGRSSAQIEAANGNTKSGFIGTFASSVIALRWAGQECGSNLLNLQNTYVGIRLRKESTDASVTDGKSDYSLAGAVFGIYSDEACTALLCTMTTGSDGVAVSNDRGMKLVTGTYYVKEVAASAGYKRNESVWTVRALSAGTMYEIVCPEAPIVTTMRLVKESADGNLTAGNALYRLEGAQYGVYANASDALSGENRVWLLTTDEDGRSGLVTGSFSGTYFIRELAASAGYELDQEIHVVTVTADVENVFTFAEVPQTTSLTVEKADSELGSGGGAQGDGSLQGAQFRWTYYAGYFRSEEDAQAAGVASRTWTFVTDEDGRVSFDAVHLIAGSELYFGEEGEAALPLGTVFVRETEASVGYLLNTAVFCSWIMAATGDGAEAVWITPGFHGCVEEQVARGGVEIAKWDAELNARKAQGDGTLAAEVEVVNLSASPVVVDGRLAMPGEVVLRATLSADGLWTSASDALPYGTYLVRETAAPEGYRSDADPRTVEVRANGTTVSLDSEDLALKDDPVRGRISVTKDLAGSDGIQEDRALLQGILIEVVNSSRAAVLVDSRVVSPGDVAVVLALDSCGTACSPLLPYGTYSLREVGSSVPDSVQSWSWTAAGTDEDIVFDTVAIRTEGGADGDAETAGTWESHLVDYAKQRVDVAKCDDVDGAPVEGTQFTLWVYDGAVIADGLVEADADAVTADDPQWRAVGTVSTDAAGIADFGLLPFGLYRIDETGSNPGYLSSAETGGLAFGTDTSRIFVLDANHAYERQLWRDARIRATVEIGKRVTGAASDGLEFVVDEDGRLRETLADGVICYEVEFGVGEANTNLDEFWVEDRCEMAGSPYDLRIVDVRLASAAAGTDLDGLVYLLAKTDRTTEGTATGMSFSQPELVVGSQATQSAFDASGWDLWGVFDAYEAQAIDVASYLEDGEFITALALCYGAVTADFRSETPLVYHAKTQHALAAGTVIPNTAVASLSRNLRESASLTEGGAGSDGMPGIFDSAEARTATDVSERVVRNEPVVRDTPAAGRKAVAREEAATGAVIARTGDVPAAVLFLLEALAAAAALVACAVRRERKQSRALERKQ